MIALIDKGEINCCGGTLGQPGLFEDDEEKVDEEAEKAEQEAAEAKRKAEEEARKKAEEERKKAEEEAAAAAAAAARKAKWKNAFKRVGNFFGNLVKENDENA